MSSYITYNASLADVTVFLFFFFNDTATTEIYTLSLHDALPIWLAGVGDDLRLVLVLTGVEHHVRQPGRAQQRAQVLGGGDRARADEDGRSEEHTSELQSRLHLVCRLLLEKKKNIMHVILHHV